MCFGSALVSMRIRIRQFSSLQIGIWIQIPDPCLAITVKVKILKELLNDVFLVFLFQSYLATSRVQTDPVLDY